MVYSKIHIRFKTIAVLAAATGKAGVLLKAPLRL